MKITATQALMLGKFAKGNMDSNLAGASRLAPHTEVEIEMEGDDMMIKRKGYRIVSYGPLGYPTLYLDDMEESE